MTKDEAKLAYALLTLYTNLYKKCYLREPSINKHRDKWAMQDVVDSVGYDRSRTLLEYYFKVKQSGHPLQWFFYNFDKLNDTLSKAEQDVARRNKLREQTRQMVEETDSEQ